MADNWNQKARKWMPQNWPTLSNRIHLFQKREKNSCIIQY